MDILKSGSEAERLLAVRRPYPLDSPPEQAYERITRLAAFICSTPTALISLADEDRQ